MSLTSPGPTARSSINRHRLLLGLILLLAASLRFYNLSRLGFWIDEFCTLSEVNGWGLQVSQLPPLGLQPRGAVRFTRRDSAQPVPQLLRRLGHEDAHPPLYFLLLRGWMDLLHGESEAVVRSLNVLLSLVAIVLLYAAIMEQSHTPAVALWGALLLAVASSQIEFSQEARNYILLEMLALAAALLLLRIERLGPTALRCGGLALIAAAMLLTHYFAAPLLGAMGIYALWNLRGRSRRRVIASIVVGTAIFAILWGRMLWAQRPVFAAGHAWLLDTEPHRAVRILGLLLRAPLRLFIEPGDSTLLNPLLWLGAALWAVVALGMSRPRLRLWALWTLVLIGAVGSSDVVQGTAQLKFTRFTVAAAPALAALVAAVAIRWRLGKLAPAALALLATAAANNAYTPPWKIDFRTPATIIGNRLEPGDAVVFIGPPGNDVGLALACNGLRHYFPANLPTTLAVLQSAPPPAELAQLAACPQLWVVWLVPQHRRIDSVLPGFGVEEAGEVPFFIEVYRGRIR